MSINNYYKLSLLIVLIVELIANGSCCTDLEWSCDNGQCITSDNFCNGIVDCLDGSDETVDLCKNESCPSFAFRCAYGACIPLSAKCNGIKDCADNSDEASSICSEHLKARHTRQIPPPTKQPVQGCIAPDIPYSTLKSESDPTKIIRGGMEITYIPWHAGIYQNFTGKFKHVCGATIISAKVLVTAAHCFWDSANQKLFDKSNYEVGAGKYLRDYYATEPNAEFKNISEIAIPTNFYGENENYQSDIAVVVLTDFLKFSPYIAPACIEWKSGLSKEIDSNIKGQTPGWGVDNNGDLSKVIRSIDVSSSSYAECRYAPGSELADSVSPDKFCVINTSASDVCQGDSGGGFIVKKLVNDREYINYLLGVVSNGVSSERKKCPEFTLVSYTNIQYFESLIMSRITSNRPK